MSTDTLALEARDVTVQFGGLRALDNVSLSVPPNSIVGMIGPNGAGKTTLFGVLSGLLAPRAGKVFLDGADVTRASAATRARKGLARTFQRLELFGELSVREHLVLAYRVRAQRSNLLKDLVGLGRRPADGEDAEVDRILDMLGLRELAHVPTTVLPLGTGRLVELARATATEPKVLLLDEPSSGLDGEETDRLVAVLRRLRDEQGTAMVLVEHNVDMVLKLADHITVLDFGEVIATGNPEEIRANPAVQAAYLGTSVT
ncbi:MAG: transporter related [Actinomycetia bacterium]|nr:transporter related [Actinomycetes bacterium]